MGIDDIANAGIHTIGTLAVIGATSKAAGNVVKQTRGIKTHKVAKTSGNKYGLSAYGSMKPTKKSRKTNQLGW